MKKLSKIIILAVILNLFLSSGVLAQNSVPDQQLSQALDQAVNYLHGMQNPDGGFPAKEGLSSSPGVTQWVIMALASVGENTDSPRWSPGGNSPLDYLENSDLILESACDYSRTLLALTAVEEDGLYKDIDLVKKISSFQQQDGQFAWLAQGEEGFVNSHMWSILALISARQEISAREDALTWLQERQNKDGGFSWLEGLDSDADDTAIAVQVMVLLGEDIDSSSLQAALKYLKSCQQEDGGFCSGWTENMSNTSTDSWVLQALIAAGEDPGGDTWSISSKNVVAHLLSLQNDDGSFNWTEDIRSSAVKGTAYVLISLAQKPFPVNIQYPSKSTAEPAVFSDLSNNHWAYTSIITLVKDGVIKGYPDGSFKADKLLSRAEFTKLLILALKFNTAESPELQFSDLTSAHWAYDYIAAAAAKGYVNGKTDDSFDPDGKLTGAELAAILVRALPTEQQIEIKSSGEYWYSDYVEAAKKNGLLYPEFNAKDYVDRAQCAYSIKKLKDIIGQSL